MSKRICHLFFSLGFLRCALECVDSPGAARGAAGAFCLIHHVCFSMNKSPHSSRSTSWTLLRRCQIVQAAL